MRFDHRRILATAISRLRAKLKYRPVVFELMADEFTLTELQRTVEAISGRHLHKQNFRRLVEGAALVEPTGATTQQRRGRPAALFRFRREVLKERPAPGFRFGRQGLSVPAAASSIRRRVIRPTMKKPNSGFWIVELAHLLGGDQQERAVLDDLRRRGAALVVGEDADLAEQAALAHLDAEFLEADAAVRNEIHRVGGRVLVEEDRVGRDRDRPHVGQQPVEGERGAARRRRLARDADEAAHLHEAPDVDGGKHEADDEHRVVRRDDAVERR